MRLPFSLTLTLLFLVATAHAGGPPWRTGGPHGGSVSTVVMAPSNHTVLYAAAPSGVFRSSDRGDSWSKITGSLRDVRYLAVDPLNENVVYGREGIVDAWGSGTSTPLNRSENGGQSWHRLSLPDLISPTAVAVDPRGSRVVYVSSHCRLEGDVSEAAGVYKSVDGGNSWAHILTNRTGVDPCASSMALDPASSDDWPHKE